MSHFTVLVVGNDIDGQMAPYHEFECTGEDNQYVQDIDETEEARKSYEKDTKTRLIAPSGKVHTKWTKQGNYKKRFLREPTPEELTEIGSSGGSGFTKRNLQYTTNDWKDGKGYRTKVVVMPKGWVEKEIPSSECVSFAEWIEGYYDHKPVKHGQKPDLKEKHKYGYTLLDKNGDVVSTINRTNPNHKWDGYCVGGRWGGFFKLKPEAVAVGAGALGHVPLMAQYDPTYEAPKADQADQALKGEIDIEGMRLEAAEKAAVKYDRFHAILAANPGDVRFEEILKKHEATVVLPPEPQGNEDDEPESIADVREATREVARQEYNAQPGAIALRADEDFKWMWSGFNEFFVDRDAFIQAAKDRAFTTFALLKDGKWYEKGHMGWWACVSDEKAQEEWNAEFNSIIDSLPDDTLLTVCDCHT